MKKFLCIVSFIANSLFSFAQVSFKTIVPKDPIVVGEAFPVQYVLENVPSETDCKPPSFKNFRLIGSPAVHKGNNGYPVKNTVYTLEATRPGIFSIDGASIDYNGTSFKSNKVSVEVITKAEAFKRGLLVGEELSASDLYLQPGEDPVKKIRNNLFVQLLTDRQSCYVGEPVTATFKLYSRLESSSDIVKNPGFYGFAVHDIYGLKNNKTEKETINGKQYTVHIIRKVQLYPLKAGVLTIDEMEIENTVVFTDSPALRKVNQQIIEGIVAEKNNKTQKPGTHEYSSSIHTLPVSIQVKDIPVAHKPADFTGATGLFTIKEQLSKTELAENEEAELLVTIAGRGNLTQLTAPVIQWPAGIEGFEPSVADSLDNTFSPLRGSRTFHYPFVVSKAGTYSFPALRFSFFNPDTNVYKQVTAKSISLHVKEGTGKANKKPGVQTNSFNTYMPAMIGTAILLLSGLFFILWRKKKGQQTNTEQVAIPEIKAQLSVKEIVQPSLAATSSDDASFYSSLRQCIWNYLSDRLGVSTVTNNARLSAALAAYTNEFHQREILQILSETETHTYGGISSSQDKEAFYQRTLNVLEKIDADIKKQLL